MINCSSLLLIHKALFFLIFHSYVSFHLNNRQWCCTVQTSPDQENRLFLIALLFSSRKNALQRHTTQILFSLQWSTSSGLLDRAHPLMRSQKPRRLTQCSCMEPGSALINPSQIFDGNLSRRQTGAKVAVALSEPAGIDCVRWGRAWATVSTTVSYQWDHSRH